MDELAGDGAARGVGRRSWACCWRSPGRCCITASSTTSGLPSALVLGTIIGIPLGKVQMTAVPQRTALSHAFGALCVTLVGTAEFYLRAPAVPQFMMAVLGWK